MKTLGNKIMAVILIGAGILTVHISGGDATACVFLCMLGIPLFFAKTNWTYIHVEKKPVIRKRECQNCSKHGTAMCPNSYFCYARPDKPQWEQRRPRMKNRCYNERKS